VKKLSKSCQKVCRTWKKPKKSELYEEEEEEEEEED
jgi:hypothetical protein